MPEHGIGETEGQFLIPITEVRRHLILSKLQYDVIQQLTKRVTRQKQLRWSPQIFLPTDEICDGTGTYCHMEPDAKTSSEQPNSISTNPRSTKYILGHNPKPSCNDGHRYQIF